MSEELRYKRQRPVSGVGDGAFLGPCGGGHADEILDIFETDLWICGHERDCIEEIVIFLKDKCQYNKEDDMR